MGTRINSYNGDTFANVLIRDAGHAVHANRSESKGVPIGQLEASVARLKGKG